MSEGHVRREPRYAVNIEVHVHDGLRRVVTETREVSRQGLFVFLDPAPAIGAELALQIHPNDDAPIHLAARVCYRLPDIGVGLELVGVPAEMGRYQGFIGRLAVSQEAWQVIGRHLGEPDPHPAASSGDRTLIGLGRSLLAVRLLFERRPPVALEVALAGQARPEDIPSAHLLVGLSAEPVEIKLHDRDRIRKVWLAVAHQGPTYVAVVPPQADGTSRWVIYALSGQEQLVVAQGGHSRFPELNAADYVAIERDRVAADSRPPKLFNVAEPPRLPKTPTGELPAFPREHLPSPSLGGWTRYDHRFDSELLALFDSLGAETRLYRVGQSERQVQLLRDLAFLVRKHGSDESPQPGTLVYDGKRLCVIFGLRSEDQKLMRPLDESDEIRLPTLDG